jgi:branched-chain amino acid transport system permease protein
MPPEAFTFDTSGQLVMQTVIGGPGTLLGPLVGAAVWLYLRDFLQAVLHLGATWKLVLGVIFVVLVTFLRHGVIGAIRDLAGLVARRAATRSEETGLDERAVVPLPAASAPIRRREFGASHNGPALEARGLTKRYGGLIANNDISFAVSPGELRGVIGPNGAGKSTFFKMLTCEVAPSAGRIFFHGQDITGKDVADVCQLGLTKSYQVNQLFTKLTVRENLTIAALAEKRGGFRIDFLGRAENLPGLTAQVDYTLGLVDLVKRAETPVAELAYGEKRRLEIGLALATSPSVLLLDEPLAGMSPQERRETVQLLKNIRRGRTLIVVEHDMDAIFNLAERITVLHEGRVLAEGTPEEIQRNGFVQNAYLGGVAAA